MNHCEDHNFDITRHKVHTIGKSLRDRSANWFLHQRKDRWLIPNAIHTSFDLPQEFLPLASALIVVPSHRFIDVRLCLDEESNSRVQLACRSLCKASSQLTVVCGFFS